MKTFRYFILIPGLFMAVFSCSKMEDFFLSETIFIEDPYYPGLPVYSEWGYNTFGVYIDRKPFVSTTRDLPAKVFVNGDTLHIILRGLMNQQNTDLQFSIKGYSPLEYFEMAELDNTLINLKEPGRAVMLKIGSELSQLNLIEGELYIKRIQQLYLDEVPTRAIMSGYFQLKTFLDNEPVAFSHGRFDLGIGYENFYNF